MFILSISWIIGFYGWYVPKHITDDKAKIEEYLILNGLEPIEMIDVSGILSTSTWKVKKSDSLGNKHVKVIDVRLYRGYYILQPH